MPDADDARPPPGPALPAVDPLQCHLLCASVDSAQCSSAPSHLDCVAMCETAIAECPALVVALFDCGGPVPTFACDADGLVLSQDCPSELTALQECAAAQSGG